MLICYKIIIICQSFLIHPSLNIIIWLDPYRILSLGLHHIKCFQDIKLGEVKVKALEMIDLELSRELFNFHRVSTGVRWTPITITLIMHISANDGVIIVASLFLFFKQVFNIRFDKFRYFFLIIVRDMEFNQANTAWFLIIHKFMILDSLDRLIDLDVSHYLLL